MLRPARRSPKCHFSKAPVTPTGAWGSPQEPGPLASSSQAQLEKNCFCFSDAPVSVIPEYVQAVQGCYVRVQVMLESRPGLLFFLPLITTKQNITGQSDQNLVGFMEENLT